VSRMNIVARAALAGAAGGGRSIMPFAAMVASAPARGWVRAAVAAAAAGELVADKLPSTPSRLRPAPLTARLVLGGVAGALLARRAGSVPVLPALTGAVAAGAASFAGARWRAFAAERGLPFPGAIAEDGAVLILAAAAVR
jgi:uncharacterized membrane protein